MKREILLACLVFAAPAMAEDCAHPQTQSQMNICANQDYQKADKALNTAYAELLGALKDPGFKTKLRIAQRSWVSFRDKECVFETAGSEGGSIHPLEYAGCLTQITKERSKAIAALTACQKNAETCE